MPDCLECKKLFDLRTTHRAGKFCSLTCYHDYQKKHRYQPSKLCPNCGKTFILEYSISKTQADRVRFCSRKCAVEAIPIWNKGLTKETDERVKLNGELVGKSRKGQESWNKGKKGIYSPETLRKIGEASKQTAHKKKVAKHDKFVENARQRQKMLWQNESFRSRLIATFNSPEGKVKRATAAKKRAAVLWGNPEYKRIMLKKLAMGQHRKPNHPEQMLDIILTKYFPNNWKYTGDGFITIGPYMPDFTNCNGKKQVIELFGDYWHVKGIKRWHQTELGRIMAYNSLGFECLIIWQHELEDEDAIVNKVRKFMSSGVRK